MTSERLLDILIGVSYLLGPILMAAFSWLSVKGAELIGAKVKNARLRGILFRLNDAVFTAVREVQQNMIDSIKAGGGVLDPRAREEAKNAAIATVKSHIGERGIKELIEILGLEEKQIDDIIGARIEAAVHDLKQGMLKAPAPEKD